MAYEINCLKLAGRSDLAEKVRHISAIEGDGAGYDIFSFTDAGEEKYIEVKTTRGSIETSFFMSINEIEFARNHKDNYSLYRVYSFDLQKSSGFFYVCTNDLETFFSFQPIQFRVSIS
jgi:hypothetical protein